MAQTPNTVNNKHEQGHRATGALLSLMVEWPIVKVPVYITKLNITFII